MIIVFHQNWFAAPNQQKTERKKNPHDGRYLFTINIIKFFQKEATILGSGKRIVQIGAKKKSSLKARLIYNPMNINTFCGGHCSGFLQTLMF
jgi:hypothetical protein